MQVFHTAGVPPSSGRIILPTIGWTRNSSVAPTNSVTRVEREDERQTMIPRRIVAAPASFSYGERRRRRSFNRSTTV